MDIFSAAAPDSRSGIFFVLFEKLSYRGCVHDCFSYELLMNTAVSSLGVHLCSCPSNNASYIVALERIYACHLEAYFVA